MYGELRLRAGCAGKGKLTHFSQAFGDSSTKRSMTISPKEVSRIALIPDDSGTRPIGCVKG